MTIIDWPEDERPREKLLKHGAGQLSDAELLAIFLRTGVTGISAVDLARETLKRFGGLRGLINASQEEFCRGHGLGLAKYVQIQAVVELSSRYLEEQLTARDVFQSAATTKRWVKQRLQSYPHEVFACLWLDSQHHLIEFQELFRGTIDAAAVYPREVVKAALSKNAAAVILCHNHPSGVAEPSRSDQAITDKLIAALQTVDIRVLDHLIVGDNSVTSLAERGLI